MRAFLRLWVVVEQLFEVFGQMVYLMTGVVKMFQKTDFEVEVPVVVLRVFLVGA